MRLVVQAFYFFLMARGLGPRQYGAFVAVVAAVAIAYPFVGNGSANLMVKNVARDRRLLPESLGNALFMTLAYRLAAQCSGGAGVPGGAATRHSRSP